MLLIQERLTLLTAVAIVYRGVLSLNVRNGAITFLKQRKKCSNKTESLQPLQPELMIPIIPEVHI